jgi:hypothetical protein
MVKPKPQLRNCLEIKTLESSLYQLKHHTDDIGKNACIPQSTAKDPVFFISDHSKVAHIHFCP